MVPLLVLLYAPFCLTYPTPSTTERPIEVPPGHGVYYKNFTIVPEWETLFAAGRDMMLFYKNVTRAYGRGHEMVSTAMIYLEHIEELERAVFENRPGALDAVWEIYLGGGPLHLKLIPWGEFVNTLKWDANDVAEFYTYINDTRRIWNIVLEEFTRVAPKDIIV